METQDESMGYEFTINADNEYEQREMLGEMIDCATRIYDAVNRRIYQQEREAAFIRYCFTGKFD